MLSGRYEQEVWAYLRVGEDFLPVHHWENIIGRGASADLRVFGSGIARTHAILSRDDKGRWKIQDVFSRGGVWVNSERVAGYGERLHDGDLINLGGSCLKFRLMKRADKAEMERERTAAGRRVNPAVTLIELSLMQLLLLLQHCFSAEKEYVGGIALAFISLIGIEWLLFALMKLMRKNGFEIETLAFFLTGLGMSVAASSTPEDMLKQLILTAASVALFLAGGLWLRSLKRSSAFRIPIAVFSMGLLALNVLAGSSTYGASNWLSFGGYSFQPSEIVKVCYVYAGSAAMDTLYKRNNLFAFIGFSALCVVALALIGDFGTALIFFVSFLVISFMRSGSIATVLLAVSGAGLAGFLAVSVKPYIKQRFASWGHVWEDVYDTGYQQTRAMSAAASGGVVGKGAGNGWLKDVFAANTDMVFAMECEELGLAVAVCMVLAVVLMAFFAVRETKRCRSAYNGIAACAAMSMLLCQLGLNVFGSLDILPFTGVTFPFVSRGGTSLISCWMLMAFLKSADNRRGSSFAVAEGNREADCFEEPPEDYSEEDYSAWEVHPVINLLDEEEREE